MNRFEIHCRHGILKSRKHDWEFVITFCLLCCHTAKSQRQHPLTRSHCQAGISHSAKASTGAGYHSNPDPDFFVSFGSSSTLTHSEPAKKNPNNLAQKRRWEETSKKDILYVAVVAFQWSNVRKTARCAHSQFSTAALEVALDWIIDASRRAWEGKKKNMNRMSNKCWTTNTFTKTFKWQVILLPASNSSMTSKKRRQ